LYLEILFADWTLVNLDQTRAAKEVMLLAGKDVKKIGSGFWFRNGLADDTFKINQVLFPGFMIGCHA
jgi:hypothetical protein